MRTKVTLSVVAVLVGTLLLAGTFPSRTVRAQSPDLGQPNPNAKELSQFAFLIGTWQADGKARNMDRRTWRDKFAFLIRPWQADGKARNMDRRTWRDTRQRWTLRYILDGSAIAGVYQRQDEDGVWTTHIMDFRYYDRDQKRWIVEYLNPTTPPWGFASQTLEEVGGVQVDETSVAVMTEFNADGTRVFRRETFSNITEDHFTYRAEGSTDGESWFEIEASEVSRVETERGWPEDSTED